MASRFISGTYQSYKAGTEKFLHWLYENAQKCGYGVEENEQTDDEDGEGGKKPQPETKKKAKPKSKPKKGKGGRAKGSGKSRAKKTSTSANPGAPKLLSVNEYSALAEAIAAFDPKVKVPLWVTAMIEEVISGRKKCARFFAQQATVTTRGNFQGSNAGHQHFIGVLEKVLAILKTVQEPAEKLDAMDLDKSDPLDRVTNMFNALEVEPDTEHTMTDPAASGTGDRKANVAIEEEHSTEETLWLIYCFFEDFNIAREHLKDTWTGYKHGAIDLTTVALSTNTAFELFKRAEEELLSNLRSTLPPDLMSQIQGYQEIQGLIYVTAATTRGMNPEFRRSPRDPYNYNLFDIADWTGLPVYIILDSFLDVIQPGSVPICKTGWFGTLNLNEDILDPEQKFTQDNIFLLERFIPEFIFLQNVKDPRTRAGIKFPAEDELTTGILEMVRTKQIPIWLVLALQVQLDIHYMLLKDIDRPHSELTAAAKKATSTVKSYQRFSENMSIVNWPESNDKLLEFYLIEWKQWMVTDLLDPLRTKTFGQLGESKRGNFVLLRNHPVLCGMMLFRLNLNMQHSGILLSNAWGALPTILHLYNACLSERLLEKSWMDLEAIIIANTAKRIFVGDRPDIPQEYLKRFMLVMGYSATMFSSDRRASTITPSKTGPRQMLRESVIAEIYGNRYLRHFESRDTASQNSGFTLAAIEKLLEEAAVVPEAASTSNDVRFSGGAFKTILARNRGEKSLLSKFAKSRKLTTIQFLTTLESSMGNESFAFNVDYFSLHMRCYGLLRTIHAEMSDVFTKYFGPHYLEAESQIPFLVGYIFQVVAGSAKAGEMVFPGQERGSKILTKVSKLLAELVEKEGEVEIQKVKKASRVFGGLEFERHYDAPTLKADELNAMVQAFNKLPRNETVPNLTPTTQEPNHWHFSLRTVNHRFDPPDLVWLISPDNALMHCAVPKRGSPIVSLTPTDQVDMVVLMLLGAFVGGVLKGERAGLPKFVPWTWSCDNATLAKNVESKLSSLGVRKELCTVKIAPEKDNKLSDEVWSGMQEGFIRRHTQD